MQIVSTLCDITPERVKLLKHKFVNKSSDHPILKDWVLSFGETPGCIQDHMALDIITP
jgi:hypothetical protein